MSEAASPFRAVRRSLTEVAGADYLAAVCAARAALTGEEPAALRQRADAPVDWYPAAFHQRLLARLPQVGTPLIPGATATAAGATSRAFAAATARAAAPLTGYGFYRVGEDGRLYLTTKSEHYHAPLGHAFPGYALLETARALGIPNATHNNTRGHLTRLLEEELVRAAHLPADLSAEARSAKADDLAPVLAAGGLQSLNRVFNLETGSLAVEAGVKLMLARHYRIQADAPAPPYAGRVPVFLVMGNDDGGLQANYHGTTVLTQLMRGMWPDLAACLEAEELLRVCPIRPNRLEDLDAAFARYEGGPYKIAGFLHEIIMMNYGARVLSREFLHHAYALCARHDVPTLVDEIQSCLWAPGLFLFREWGLRPSCVALGKGFPGGEYPASRLLFSAALDTLPQFGALVTNGQEELASLAYLITMQWAQANADVVRQIGDAYEAQVRALAARYPETIAGITGGRHLLGLEFHELAAARAFTGALNRAGFDISAQTYKADCPPVALTKLPLTACPTVVDFIVGRMAEALAGVAESNTPSRVLPRA
jgi:acetylornithine/succinyldiaminopimelate/putrescine aminotransferase